MKYVICTGMKKAVVFILLILVAVSAWSQKKTGKGKKNSAPPKPAASNPRDSSLRIFGKEFVVNVERLDITVNSKSPELFPVISPDGKTLYFSRKSYADNKFGLKDMEDIWYSERVDGKWDYAKNMETLNTTGANYICQILSPQSKGQLSMILGNDYMLSGRKKAPLFISHSTDGVKWTKPQKIRITAHKGFSQKTDCFMTRDRKFLIISWEGPEGIGKKDLWVAAAGLNNSFEKPVNLGPNINTKGDDRSPFLLPDGNTLFFSSDGYKDTHGGHDIYVAHRNGASRTSWTAPKNLGPKINDKLDELGFSIQEGTNKAFFCRGVSEEDTDIFTAKVSFGTKVVTIKGKFLDKTTKKPVVGRILLIQDAGGDAIFNSSTDEKTGAFNAQVPSGNKYHMFAISSEGKRSEPLPIDLNKISGSPVEAPVIWFTAGEEPKADSAMLNSLLAKSSSVLSASGKKMPVPVVIEYPADSAKVGLLTLVALSSIATYAFLNQTAQVTVTGFMEKKREKITGQRVDEIIDYFVTHGVSADRIKNQLMPADPAKNEVNTCKVEVQE